MKDLNGEILLPGDFVYIPSINNSPVGCYAKVDCLGSGEREFITVRYLIPNNFFGVFENYLPSAIRKLSKEEILVIMLER